MGSCPDTGIDLRKSYRGMRVVFSLMSLHLIGRTLWKKCCFSGDGEYICAGKKNISSC